MHTMSFTHAFVASGLVLANMAAYFAYDRKLAAWARGAVFLGLYALWIAVYEFHERGAPALAMPGHVLFVALALFTVFGFPTFVVQLLRKKSSTS